MIKYLKEEDFENPTIIEFTDVKQFLEDYQKEAGRPHTSCNDIFVSYDAYEDFQNCKPDDFYAFFSELKQWANREKGNIVIKDKQRKEYFLGENMEISEKVVNPIELYAYYIGLYITNIESSPITTRNSYIGDFVALYYIIKFNLNLSI